MMTSLAFFSLLVLVPLAIGLGLLFIVRRLKRAEAQVGASLFGVFCLLVSIFYLISIGPYLWALHLESNWEPADPKTKKEMESFLSLYTEREIEFDTPGWGSAHAAKAGERMVRYTMLFGAALDVVYTEDDRLVEIYTTYE